MKKTIFLTLILILLLTACGSNTGSATEASTNTGFDPGSQELELSTQLALGTLKLEGTDLAVTSDQAAELLPLWQVFDSLSSSDTAAPEEVTAVVEQIQETMTPEQIQAIEKMALTNQDIFASMQELGLTNAPQVNAEGTPQAGGGFRDSFWRPIQYRLQPTTHRKMIAGRSKAATAVLRLPFCFVMGAPVFPLVL